MGEPATKDFSETVCSVFGLVGCAPLFACVVHELTRRCTPCLLQVEAVFSNAAYYVTVSTINGDTLCVEVEQKSDCSRWRGDFTSRCERKSKAVSATRSQKQARALLLHAQCLRSRVVLSAITDDAASGGPASLPVRR